MRALLIVNERSRRGARSAQQVCEELARLGVECTSTRDGQSVDAVIAAGGDGTVVGAIPHALSLGVPLAIIPLGTFNDLARTLDLPMEVERACEVAAKAKTVTIDLGRVNGAYFVNEASVGISTRAARRQTPQVKQRLGFIGVFWSGVRAIARSRPFFVDVSYGDKRETFHTMQLTIANSGRFGGVISRSDASIDDGWLDLYSVEVRSWLQALALLRKVVRGDPTPGDGLRTRRGKCFEVRTLRAHHITADGEPAGHTPAVFEVLPLALKVIVA